MNGSYYDEFFLQNRDLHYKGLHIATIVSRFLALTLANTPLNTVECAIDCGVEQLGSSSGS